MDPVRNTGRSRLYSAPAKALNARNVVDIMFAVLSAQLLTHPKRILKIVGSIVKRVVSVPESISGTTSRPFELSDVLLFIALFVVGLRISDAKMFENSRVLRLVFWVALCQVVVWPMPVVVGICLELACLWHYQLNDELPGVEDASYDAVNNGMLYGTTWSLVRSLRLWLMEPMPIVENDQLPKRKPNLPYMEDVGDNDASEPYLTGIRRRSPPPNNAEAAPNVLYGKQADPIAIAAMMRQCIVEKVQKDCYVWHQTLIKGRIYPADVDRAERIGFVLHNTAELMRPSAPSDRLSVLPEHVLREVMDALADVIVTLEEPVFEDAYADLRQLASTAVEDAKYIGRRLSELL